MDGDDAIDDGADDSDDDDIVAMYDLITLRSSSSDFNANLVHFGDDTLAGNFSLVHHKPKLATPMQTTTTRLAISKSRTHHSRVFYYLQKTLTG